jgi:hypothetical protein
MQITKSALVFGKNIGDFGNKTLKLEERLELKKQKQNAEFTKKIAVVQKIDLNI